MSEPATPQLSKHQKRQGILSRDLERELADLQVTGIRKFGRPLVDAEVAIAVLAASMWVARCVQDDEALLAPNHWCRSYAVEVFRDIAVPRNPRLKRINSAILQAHRPNFEVELHYAENPLSDGVPPDWDRSFGRALIFGARSLGYWLSGQPILRPARREYLEKLGPSGALEVLAGLVTQLQVDVFGETIYDSVAVGAIKVY